MPRLGAGSTELQRAHYERHAHGYAGAREAEAARAFDAHWTAELLRRLPRGGRVLEAMCGTAEALRAMDGPGVRVGLDISRAMLGRAAGGSLAAGDVARMPFAAGAFDAVVIRGGLHHVHWMLDGVLGEVHRVLAPSGMLLAAEPSDDFWPAHVARSAMYRMSRKFHPETERGLFRGELDAALGRAGFFEREFRRFGYAAYALIGNLDVLPLLKNVCSRSAIRGLIALDAAWAKAPGLSRMNLVWLIAARRR